MMLKNGKLEMVRFICKNMIEDCNSVLEIAPGNSDAPSLKVNTLIAKAQATFKIGKEWYLTSRVSEAFKKFSRAINHCEQALKIDPKNSEARFLRDEIWCYQGKFKEVIKLANETYQKDYSGMMAYLETLADRYPQIRDEYDKLKKIEIEKRKTPDAKQEVFGDPVKYFLLAAGLLPKAAAYFFGSMTSSYGGNILPKKPVSCNFFEKYNTNTFEDEPGLKCYPGFDKL